MAEEPRAVISGSRAAGRSSWNPYSFGGVIRIYAVLLPLSALAAGYLLLLDRFTATSQESLREASYGKPFAWVTQDLSRYEYGEFPVTLEFNWQREWSDPIATDANWFLFVANTAVVGIGVTAAFVLLVAVIRRFARGSGRAA